MARSTYDQALVRLLAHEGGYTNHPSDPGGPTNFGITIGDYRRYVNADATAADIRTMRVDQAKAIYRARYWATMRCDELPAGLDYATFDYGVNSGTGRAAKVLQRLVGLPADGRMSDAVIAAVQKQNTGDLIVRLCDERLAFLKRLKTWPVFGTGWGRRVADVRAAALTMAAQAKAPAKTEPAGSNATVPAKASIRIAWAGAVAAAAAAITRAAHQAGAHPVAVVAVVGIALAAGGWLAWRWAQRNRQQVQRGE
jgi:lysozyme family protein